MINDYGIETDAIAVRDVIAFKLDVEHYAEIIEVRRSRLGGREFVVRMREEDGEAQLEAGDEHAVWERDAFDHLPSKRGVSEISSKSAHVERFA